MNEVINLLQDCGIEANIEMSSIDTKIRDVKNMISLIESGVSTDENRAVHDMLDIVNKNLEKILDDDIINLKNRLGVMSDSLMSLDDELSKPRRTRKPRSTTDNKDKATRDTRRKAVNKDSSIDKDKSIDKEKIKENKSKDKSVNENNAIVNEGGEGNKELDK